MGWWRFVSLVHRDVKCLERTGLSIQPASVSDSDMTEACCHPFRRFHLFDFMLRLLAVCPVKFPHPRPWIGRCPAPEGYFWAQCGAVYQESVVTLDSCEQSDRSRVDLSLCLHLVLVLSLSLSHCSCNISYDITEHHCLHTHTHAQHTLWEDQL